ncbi:MAG: 2Fe-2S iron-sulfur cluster-binding protein [Phenylobacterium sp.]|uniref:2Fe-2S iron-sulfur cluster-binding protein n=1 Tax=Phenylobacterium ferrooxidans TaxID=2982689 RepID=A0ABW6CXN1_9CAUL|nr:2Fe-2S iron-sulfur cluster-binding protein [Phenylobacterium sp.]MDZ4052036.1 2Fe-2S iron-sulfur cluster-binding protein [Phenylobacterium sp.]
MTKITYVMFDGGERAVDLKTGVNLMQGAVANNIPGIDGDCGGACACATCHIYVDAAWLPKVGPRTAMEDSMLEFAEHVEANSRLACQITVRDELAGMVVRLPEAQH